MEEAVTPTVPENGTPPVAPVATPAVEPGKVVLTKEEHDQLARDAARGRTNQRKADLFDRSLKQGHFKTQTPAIPPSKEEQDAAAIAEDRKAEQGLTRLALDPAYREVFDNDPTLRDLFTKNPLAILPVLAPDALDAEDAIALVMEALNSRKTPAKPVVPVTPPVVPVTPPAGGVNPPSVPQASTEYETARKLPNTEAALAGMINSKIKDAARK